MHRIARSRGFSHNSLESCVSYPMPNLLKSCHYEVSVLLQHLALPKQGHLEMVYHVFAYLNKHENLKIVFDLMTVELANPNVFKKVDWSDVYDLEDIKDELPPWMPEPRGQSVKMSVFVDADHAGNKVTR